MPAWAWVLIAVAVIAIVVLIVRSMYSRRRTQELRSQFGPEYARTVAGTGSRRAAETELDARRKRREELAIRPLPDATRQRYAEEWRVVQTRFVDQPGASLSEADQLVTSVMQDRGYPMDDFDSNLGDVSVDHPNVVENYRAAHAISLANDHDRASTEDLRQGMVYYRALFEELLADEAGSAQGVG
jgi:FtsZ-interacting cell division protein ZipA